MNYNPENVADRLYAEMQEKQYRKKAWNRKNNFAPDDPKSWLERIIMLFSCFVIALALVCLVVMNYEKLKPVWKFMDTPAFGLTFSLVSVACFLWYMITRRTPFQKAFRSETEWIVKKKKV